MKRNEYAFTQIPPPILDAPCTKCGKPMNPLEAIVMGPICKSCVRKAHAKVMRR